MVQWIEKKAKIEADREDDLKTRILKARGIRFEDHEDFLFPDERFENKPFEIRNMEEACNTILDAVAEEKNIVVSGDPDADGVTSLAIMVNRLRELFTDGYEFGLEYIYPQRDMGHGLLGQLTIEDRWSRIPNGETYTELNTSNIAKVEKADVLIVLDSSSNDIKGVQRAKELAGEDLKVIILDHHQFDVEDVAYEMDEHAILVNPHHPDDESINKALSGAGMTYKACKGIDEILGQYDFSNQYRDLMAVGMVGDMMDMTNYENRFLIAQGLQNVKNIGLTRILKGAKVNTYRYNTKDIGFSVAPLINSSARMGEIELAIEILLVDNDKDAKKLRLKMDKLNKKRKEQQQGIMQKYEDEQDMSKKIIIIIDEESNKGMNGLVAQNIAQKYHRPCFVVTKGADDICRGSGRSYGKFNTNDFLSELDFVEAQGHGQAHGLSFPLNKLEELEEYIEDNMPDNLESEQTFYYDVELFDPAEAMMDFTELANINYITGTGFPEVVVRIDGVMIEERQVIGKTKETIKFTTDEELCFMKFRVDEEWRDDIDMFDEVSVVGSANINEFYNFGTKEMTRTPQIMIMDIIKD